MAANPLVRSLARYPCSFRSGRYPPALLRDPMNQEEACTGSELGISMESHLGFLSAGEGFDNLPVPDWVPGVNNLLGKHN